MCIIIVAGDIMVIDIIKLKNNIVDYIEINEEKTFEKETYQNTDIIELSKVSINGDLTKDNYSGYNLNVTVKGKMVLPCSLTLKPVDYPFEFSIDGNIEELFEEIGKNFKNTQNSIDILPIIWENILMEIPMKVTSSDISDMPTSGDGWCLVTEEVKRINPELEKLKDLL